jgi:[protein-PII] uridylyltransferase
VHAPPVDSAESTARFRAAREALIADPSVTGRAFAEALRDLVDGWLSELFALAVAATRKGADGMALVAVGGYGRGDLCPGSDIDVLLLHSSRRDVAEVAEQLWYPVWDAGIQLGHSVRTLKEALAFASDDLDTATALLSARTIAGDAGLAGELSEKALAQWRKRGRHYVSAVVRGVVARQATSGEVAYLLEPDLKEGRGGLRDVHALGWAERARPVHDEGDVDRLAQAYDTLLAVRVELHRLTGRRGDTLALQYQDGVAEALGDADADVLMGRIAAAARAIAWTADEAWDQVGSWLEGPGGASGRERELSPGVRLSDGMVHVGLDASVDNDPTVALRAAAGAARHRTRIDRPSLRRLAAARPPMPDVWPPEMLAAWTDLLLAGHDALPVIEALDQVRVWERLVPEWGVVRNRPQRNAYHRFTVDRHLLETVANAASWRDRVSRPDLLVTGALLHDLGKGRPGDHTEVGVALAAVVGPRMGFGPDDVRVLQAMVEHHLLLPDVATRRDLSDPTTAERVAEAVGSVLVLELLWALCEADSLATGSSAWGPWKAELVAELVTRARAVLEGAPLPEPRAAFPTAQQAALMDAGERAVTVDGDTLTVVAPDRPGLFSRVAGVLALHGLDVVAADAVSRGDIALEQFKVAPAGVGPRGFGDDWTQRWPKVAGDVERAVDGRLAVHARVAERARVYKPKLAMPGQAPPQVAIDNGASSLATVVEVSAPDSVGLLYRLTRALADLDLDLSTAKVQTLGAVVVDAFYVVDGRGEKITDAEHLREIERAVLHAVHPGV